jgi:hypothetical protein
MRLLTRAVGAPPDPEARRPLRLLVLRKRQDQVRKLVAGPGDWICDQ